MQEHVIPCHVTTDQQDDINLSISIYKKTTMSVYALQHTTCTECIHFACVIFAKQTEHISELVLMGRMCVRQFYSCAHAISDTVWSVFVHPEHQASPTRKHLGISTKKHV